MLKWFKRKKEVVKEEQVGSMLWPYTSKVSIPNVEGIEQEINSLDQRVSTLENAPTPPPSGGEGIGEERVNELINQSLEPVNTSINTNKTNIASNLTKINTNTSKITTIENRLNNLPSGGVGMSEVKKYVDPKFNDLTAKVTNNTNTLNRLSSEFTQWEGVSGAKKLGEIRRGEIEIPLKDNDLNGEYFYEFVFYILFPNTPLVSFSFSTILGNSFTLSGDSPLIPIRIDSGIIKQYAQVFFNSHENRKVVKVSFYDSLRDNHLELVTYNMYYRKGKSADVGPLTKV